MVTPTKASATTTKRAPAKAGAPVVPQMRYAAAVGLPTTINLPRWNDAGSVTAFGMTIITFALGILTMAHVTVPNNTSDTASTPRWLPRCRHRWWRAVGQLRPHHRAPQGCDSGWCARSDQDQGDDSHGVVTT